MPSISPESLLYILVLIPPLLFSLVIHEYAHARTALAFGDPTAYRLGRVTFNPLAHLDPIGTICIVVGGFGWAKPVPVNPANLHPPRLGDIAVSLAGPLSNLALAVVLSLLLRAWIAISVFIADPTVYDAVYRYILYVASVNIALFAFNLLPLFPLDGHHVARELLPLGAQSRFMDWQRQFGLFLLIALMFGPRLVSSFAPHANLPDPLGIFLGWASSVISLVLRI